MEAAGAGVILMILIFWYLLNVIGCWKLFKKAGVPGWLSLIPVINIIEEYKICWSGGMGVLFFLALAGVNSISQAAAESSGAVLGIAGVLAFIVVWMQVVESSKLARAFGKGLGYTLILIFFDRLGRIMLGFSSARYIGKP